MKVELTIDVVKNYGFEFKESIENGDDTHTDIYKKNDVTILVYMDNDFQFWFKNFETSICYEYQLIEMYHHYTGEKLTIKEVK
jgi:hypothetical protein